MKIDFYYDADEAGSPEMVGKMFFDADTGEYFMNTDDGLIEISKDEARLMFEKLDAELDGKNIHN